MGKGRRNKLIIRWSIFTSCLIGLFWLIYYLIIGEIPIITSVKITPTWVVPLPFGISRLWDILIGPIWSTNIIFIIFAIEKNDYIEDYIVNIGITFGTNLFVGLATGLVSGLGVGLVIGLWLALVFGIILRMYGCSLRAGLVSSLFVGLGNSLGGGLVGGLVGGLGVGLSFVLVAGLVIVSFHKSFWKKISNWLLVR